MKKKEIIEHIYLKRKPAMIKVAMSILNDYALAEDAFQDAMMGIDRVMREKLDDDEVEYDTDSFRFRNYLNTAVKYSAINIIRRESKIQRIPIDDYEIEALSMDNVERDAFRDKYEFGIEIQELLMNLENIDRDIITLKYGSGFSDKEIGAILGLSSLTVQKRNYRARKRIEESLSKRGKGDK